MSINEAHTLPDVLASLITEFALPSFRLKDSELIVNTEKKAIVVPAKPGLWYAQWGPYTYLPYEPYLGSVRPLVLTHEKKDMKDFYLHAVIESIHHEGKTKSWIVDDVRSDAKNILLCSRDGPLLNITPRYREERYFLLELVPFVAVTDGVIALLFRRYNTDIEKNAFTQISRKVEPKRDAILHELGLKTENAPWGLVINIKSAEDLLKLFTAQELEERKIPLSMSTIEFVIAGKGWWARDNKHEYSFPNGFALASTRQLALLMSKDIEKIITMDPEFNADWYQTLRELEARNRYEF